MASAAEERALLAVKAAAAAGLILAAASLPWATARSLAGGRTTLFKGGPLSLALIVLAAVTLALSGVRLIRSSSTVDAVQIIVATAIVPIAIALALTKIGLANRVVSHAPSHTSYALGPVAALAAGGVILVTSTALAFVSRPSRGLPADAVHVYANRAAAGTGRPYIDGGSPPQPGAPRHVEGATSTPTRAVPLPAKWAAIGAVSAGLVGGVAGLVVGLRAYAPTAWFAILELGIPSAAIGGLVGLASGAIASVVSQD